MVKRQLVLSPNGDREHNLRFTMAFGDYIMAQVLVVDDSPVIRKITRRILEGMRFKTSEAADGRQALAACSFMMPDAIFLDSAMPVLDGYDFLRELRQMPGGDRPKIILCSTEHDVSIIARAMHAGADDFLMKPFDRKTVESKFADLAEA